MRQQRVSRVIPKTTLKKTRHIFLSLSLYNTYQSKQTPLTLKKTVSSGDTSIPAYSPSLKTSPSCGLSFVVASCSARQSCSTNRTSTNIHKSSASERASEHARVRGSSAFGASKQAGEKNDRVARSLVLSGGEASDPPSHIAATSSGAFDCERDAKRSAIASETHDRVLATAAVALCCFVLRNAAIARAAPRVAAARLRDRARARADASVNTDLDKPRARRAVAPLGGRGGRHNPARRNRPTERAQLAAGRARETAAEAARADRGARARGERRHRDDEYEAATAAPSKPYDRRLFLAHSDAITSPCADAFVYVLGQDTFEIVLMTLIHVPVCGGYSSRR